MKSTVLLIDDDPIDIKALQMLLESWDFEVHPSRSGRDGIAKLQTQLFDLIVSDVRMPEMTGEDVVKSVTASHPDIPVVLVTGHGDIRSAVEAMKLGAFDYVVKPPNEDEFKITITRAIEHSRLKNQNRQLMSELHNSGFYGDKIIGKSHVMLELFDVIDRVSRTDSTVMIIGETGTGKELVARSIHYKSKRAFKPLIAVNCATLQQNLVESELFGHEKGAFTGAIEVRRGKFEEADGGTLFLDEISEISLEMQAKLLRVLQEGECQRLGSNKTIKVDVRIIAATNRNIEEFVKAGRFRQDLFYRLMVIPVDIPPLRKRQGDIPLLALHFLDLYGKRYRSETVSISAKALSYLSSLEWTGNVRELQHAVERAVIMSNSSVLEPCDFISGEKACSDSPLNTLQSVLDARTKEYLLQILKDTDNHKQKTADILGIDRTTLYRLLKKYDIE